MTKIAPLAALLALLPLSGPAFADSIAPREGWAVYETAYGYGELLERLHAAVRASGMAVVTEAGPTEAARARGENIPGNRVLGVFRNDFAVRAVRLAPAAMIEAPIRFYVTEDGDGTATLSYKTPSFVFAPYADLGGLDLGALAAELDTIFAGIAQAAIH